MSMIASCEEERALESEITDLRLSTLEAIARENCALSLRMEIDMQELKGQLQLLLKRLETRDACTAAGEPGDSSTSKFSVSPAATDAVSLAIVRRDEDSVHMCDYCFTFSPNCFSCPLCAREWYCSDVCQRLRQRCHASRCRACFHHTHEVISAEKSEQLDRKRK